jgi:hypothetical protein
MKPVATIFAATRGLTGPTSKAPTGPDRFAVTTAGSSGSSPSARIASRSISSIPVWTHQERARFRRQRPVLGPGIRLLEWLRKHFNRHNPPST